MVDYCRENSKQKWTIMKYMKDFDLMTIYAYALRKNASLTDEGIAKMLEEMKNDGVYSPRKQISIDTGKFKIIQIAWYMFGFYSKGRTISNSEKKFVFSPLGNLLLDNIGNSEKVSKIFLTMLMGNPFRQPFSKMSTNFNLFPFRLLFKLLLEPRIEKKLFNDEIFYLLMFVKRCDQSCYEDIIQDILKLRKIDTAEKLKIFRRNESVIANSIHEWSYASQLFQGAGILSISEGESVGSLVQGNNTGHRAYRTNSVTLTTNIQPFTEKMVEKYPFDEKPYPEGEDAQGSFIEDVVMSFYSFYPKELLIEIGEESGEQNQELLNIVTLINKYSHNEVHRDYDLFEDALSDSFNLFKDVSARKISGPGEPDIVCIYSDSQEHKKNFTLEAKSTKNKLIQVNSSRLRQHRERHSLKYTIVVTPDYTPACIRDIENEPITIIKASVITNYFYQSIKKYGRELSYTNLNNLVENSLGKELTPTMINYIYDEFGVSY